MEEKVVFLDYCIKDYKEKIKILQNDTELNCISKEKAMTYCKSLKYKYISIFSKEYPYKLKLLKNPPLVLYYYGDINLLNSNLKAIMGAYKNTLYGQKACEKLIKKMDGVVLSGFSYGIEQLSHKYALKVGLKNVVILASNLEYTYPKNDDKLFNSIKEYGLVISIFPKNISLKKNNFKIRNELIGVLCHELYIIEADYKCGVLKAVDSAIYFANDVFVLPGSVFSKESKLSNLLISQGANILLIN